LPSKIDRNLNQNGFSQIKRRLKFACIVMIAIAIIGITIREIEYLKLRQSTDQLAILTVTTITAASAPEHEEIILPGNVAGWHTASIYARTNGYIKEWKADIGARVKMGDVLAVIETPEVNAQLQQAEADLKTAEANNELAYQKALYLTRKRFKGGAAPVADVDQAEAQLENAKTLSADNRLKRAQLEHAIAKIIGQPPSGFSLRPAIGKIKLVTLTPYLPSTLLERRPDIAAAELRVQAANAAIGVARAAYFPDFNLAAGIGLESKV